ncbi:hypothetical protein ACOZ38_13020 [Sphaerisporangium viridialbum]|uniref:hypothetical protein n=1 Tax=Sphaerisporangium viridialbum TaxID=46189 RepID=UPI003C733D9A
MATDTTAGTAAGSERTLDDALRLLLALLPDEGEVRGRLEELVVALTGTGMRIHSTDPAAADACVAARDGLERLLRTRTAGPARPSGQAGDTSTADLREVAEHATGEEPAGDTAEGEEADGPEAPVVGQADARDGADATVPPVPPVPPGEGTEGGGVDVSPGDLTEPSPAKASPLEAMAKASPLEAVGKASPIEAVREARRPVVGDLDAMTAEALADVLTRMSGDRDVSPHAVPYQVPSAGSPRERAAVTWERVHMLALRLAPEVADLWRGRAWEAVASAARDHAAATGAAVPQATPPDEPPDLPPSLEVIGYPGPDLSAGSDASTWDDLRRSLAKRDLAHLVDMARQACWLAGHDQGLWHGFDVVTKGLEEASGSNLNLYLSNMRTRLTNLVGDSPGPVPEFRRLLALDEALRGLVPLPLPHRRSWWGRRTALLSDGLLAHPRSGDCNPRLQGSTFRTLVTTRRVDDGDPSVSASRAGTSPSFEGKVVWVLRVADPEPPSGRPSLARVVYVKST